MLRSCRTPPARAEELPGGGDYATYNIGDEMIILVRSEADGIKGFYNVCLHRGRRLTEGCGHTNQFYCRFHGWTGTSTAPTASPSAQRTGRAR